MRQPLDGSPKMHAVVEDILRRFEKFPEAHVEHDASSVTYLPPSDDGFRVRLRVVRKDWFTVHYSECWERFSREAAAVDSFALGLSNARRVREFILFGRPCYWEIESRDFPFETWHAIRSESRPLGWILPFTPHPIVRTLQNDLSKLDASGGACRAC